MSSCYTDEKSNECLRVPFNDIYGWKQEKRKYETYIFFWAMFVIEMCFTGIWVLLLSHIYRYNIMLDFYIKYFIYVSIINSYFFIKNMKNEIVISILSRYIFCCIVNIFVIFIDFYLSYKIHSSNSFNSITKFTSEQSSFFLSFTSWILLCTIYYVSKGIEKTMDVSKGLNILFLLFYTIGTLILLTENIIQFTGLIDVLTETYYMPFLSIFLFKLAFFTFYAIKMKKLRTIALPGMLCRLYFWHIYKHGFLALKFLVNLNM